MVKALCVPLPSFCRTDANLSDGKGMGGWEPITSNLSSRPVLDAGGRAAINVLCPECMAWRRFDRERHPFDAGWPIIPMARNCQPRHH